MERTFLVLVLHTLLGVSLLNGEQFWFSYKIVTVNSIAIFEEKNITPAMTSKEAKFQKICDIDLVYDNKLSKDKFLKQHFDMLMPCFTSLTTHLLSVDDRHIQSAQDRIEVVIEPIRFTVDFKEEFATISTIR